jgi:predicted nuclease with RNAse H fold
MLSVGVDVSKTRALDVVVLDERRRLVGAARSRVSPTEPGKLLSALGRKAAVVAIDSPPGPGLAGGTRPCEAALRRRGVQVFSTASDPQRFAGQFFDWARVGMLAFEAARGAGFEPYAEGAGVCKRALEVFPHATDVFLRGELPPARTSRSKAAKRQWRYETLRSAGVEVGPSASLDTVDAALAALTGQLALLGQYEAIGEDPFFIIVPGVGAVKGRFLRAASTSGRP